MLFAKLRVLRRIAALSIAAAAVGLASASLDAQQSPPPSHWELVSVRSGVHRNPAPVEGVVWRDFVMLPAGTPWLRLYYGKVFLGKGSYLRIVSLLDGDFMTQHQVHVEQWSSTSCFFNGAAVMIELIAGPHTDKNYVEIDKVMAGDAVPVILPPQTICGSVDDRVPSSDPRVGRIDTIGCTGWIVNLPAVGPDKCHLSAGHCYGTGQVLEFAVPASTTSCSIRHPPSAKQFAIDAATSQRVDAGIGNDYWVFRCFANATTGRSTFLEQGAAFDLAAAIPGAGTTVRITGFGIDGSPTNGGSSSSCGCISPNGARNMTEQTNTGPVVSNAGTTLTYAVDTCGGDSGSPVIDEVSGLAVAIHTHGGCTTTTAANLGTQITLAGLQAAIAAVAPGGGAHPNEECFLAQSVGQGINGRTTTARPARRFRPGRAAPASARTSGSGSRPAPASTSSRPARRRGPSTRCCRSSAGAARR